MARKRPDRNRIDQELLCMECLKARLKTRLGHEGVDSERALQGKDPPDFWLSVGSARFPIEVTSLVDNIATHDRVIEAVHFSKICERIANAIEERAKEEGCLSGTYVITIKRTADIHQHFQNILQQALAYLRRTRGDKQTEGVTVHKCPDGALEIEKLGGEGARVHVGQGRGKWEGDSSRSPEPSQGAPLGQKNQTEGRT
jgi:hypothetical protein